MTACAEYLAIQQFRNGIKTNLEDQEDVCLLVACALINYHRR